MVVLSMEQTNGTLQSYAQWCPPITGKTDEGRTTFLFIAVRQTYLKDFSKVEKSLLDRGQSTVTDSVFPGIISAVVHSRFTARPNGYLTNCTVLSFYSALITFFVQLYMKLLLSKMVVFLNILVQSYCHYWCSCSHWPQAEDCNSNPRERRS